MARSLFKMNQEFLIATAEQVRTVDRLTSEKYGVSGLSLMYNAAKAVFEEVIPLVKKADHICILCGKGNNAGDGFALAGMLADKFSKVTVSLLCGTTFSPDARHYFEKLPNKVVIQHNTVPDADIYIDAVFGTGFSGALPPHMIEQFEIINSKAAKRIAIDVPSGLSCDSGIVSAGCFRADKCVTFELLKVCHLMPVCREFCGEVCIKEIGLKDEAKIEAGIRMFCLDGYDLPSKDITIHKGDNGTLLSVVGSARYQGAATLSVMSALRSGVGILIAFVPESIYVPLASKVNSAIIVSCHENALGTHSKDLINKLNVDIKNRVPSAILAGSGMGLGDDVASSIEHILGMDIPCLIDGDGLRYVRSELLGSRNVETILTPHMGEFALMTGRTIADIAQNRIEICRTYAKENNCVLVLKDSITIISSPDGEQWILSSPNPALAKGGSGDVLAGLIASFMAQGFSAVHAARAGVWFHSAAARQAANQKGSYATLPEDIIQYFPNVFIK